MIRETPISGAAPGARWQQISAVMSPAPSKPVTRNGINDRAGWKACATLQGRICGLFGTTKAREAGMLKPIRRVPADQARLTGRGRMREAGGGRLSAGWPTEP